MRYQVAAAQFATERERKTNIKTAHKWVKAAASVQADILLLPELFEFPYFPIERGADQYFSEATPLSQHPYISEFQECARTHKMAIPFSFFEREETHYYNALAFINPKGEITGVYRKTHIPSGEGYEEDYYFKAGAHLEPNSPSPVSATFPVWDMELQGETVVRTVTLGAGICWDQWFSEPARIMALSGAELLLYPTAIGTEPEWIREHPHYSSQFHWQQVMCGHAAANVIPVAAANRIGTEKALRSNLSLTFYGSSFIADHEGRVVKQLDNKQAGLITYTFDLDAIRKFREYWGLLRARRPELYPTLTTPTE